MKKLAWYTAVSLATLAVVYMLWEFRTAVVLFIMSLVVGAVLRPLVDGLYNRGLPRWLGLVITYIGVAALITVLGFTIGRLVVNEAQSLAANLPNNYDQLKNQWLNGSLFQQVIARNLPDLNNLFQIVTSGQWNAFVQSFMGLTLGSIQVISETIMVIILSIYWTADEEHFKRVWLSLLPSESRIQWRDVWQNVEKDTGSYLRSEIIQSLILLIILGVSYQLIGLKYPALLALLGALGWLFVWFGGLIAVIPAFLAGFSISPGIGILAALLTILVLAFLEFVVEPRIFNRRRVSSFLVVIMVLIMVKQYGIIGFLAAPPMAVAIQAIASQIFRTTSAVSIPVPPPADIQIEILKKRLNTIKTQASSRAVPPAQEVTSLIERLEQLIARANQEERIID